MNEYILILLLVCLPMTLLLAAFLVFRAKKRAGWYARFPDYSLEIRSFGHGGGRTVVVYSRNDWPMLEFPAHLERGSKFLKSHINVEIPASVRDEDIADCSRNLVAAFQKLRYEYVIYRAKTGRSSEREVLASSPQQ